MALEKFNLTDVLTRNREGLNLTACNVLIAKGKPDSFEFTTLAEVDTFLAGMENIGVNDKGSPTWKNEDQIKEVDYEDRTNGVKGEGSIVLVDVNAGMQSFVDNDLRGEIVTIAIVPKDYVPGDQFKIIYGIKLTASGEGKGNDDASEAKMTLSYKIRAKKRSDFERIIEIPEA